MRHRTLKNAIEIGLMAVPANKIPEFVTENVTKWILQRIDDELLVAETPETKKVLTKLILEITERDVRTT